MQSAPTILLADDNPDNLEVLSKILEEKGYRVRTAKNGRLALNSIQAEIPDLALIDLHMPVMDGYELCKQIKNNSRFEHIPVLFISAIGESFNKVIAFEMGAVDYISKPVDPQEVLARVNTHLKIQRLQQELQRRNQSLETQVSERTEDLQRAHGELKELHERLQSLDEAKNDFLRLISHELRSPLVGLGIADELLGGHPLSEEDSQSFQNIFWASHQKLLNIVNHATVLTRLNLNELETPSQDQPVQELLEEASESLQPLLNASDVQIQLKGDPEQSLSCNREYGKMVFNALLETAIKFSTSGNPIRVEWQQDPDACTIQIHADGWTVPEQYQEQFFEVLTIHDTLFPGGDLGLGPAVAKQVVQACGGSVEICNRNDQGITFTVTFPQSNEETP